jgi:hypothetical protein
MASHQHFHKKQFVVTLSTDFVGKAVDNLMPYAATA